MASLNVILLFSSDSFADDTVQLIQEQNKINNETWLISTFNIANSTPSYAQLSNFDVLYIDTSSSACLHDPVALGNVVELFFRTKGRLVLCCFSNLDIDYGGCFVNLQGEFLEKGYHPLNVSSVSVGDKGVFSICSVYEPQHPIMNNVQSFYGRAFSGHVDCTQTSDSRVICSWACSGACEVPLVVERNLQQGTIMALNMCSASSRAYENFWPYGQCDGAQLIYNTIKYVGTVQLPCAENQNNL